MSSPPPPGTLGASSLITLENVQATSTLESSRGSQQPLQVEEYLSYGFVEDSSGGAKGKPTDIFKESTESSKASYILPPDCEFLV